MDNQTREHASKEAAAHLDLAACYLQKGELNTAASHIGHAVQFAIESEDLVRIADAYRMLAKLESDRGDDYKAIIALETGMKALLSACDAQVRTAAPSATGQRDTTVVKLENELARLKTENLMLRSNEIERIRETLSEREAEVMELRASLDANAGKDQQTGLPNRNAVIERITLEATRFPRGKKPFSLLLADIDSLKVINEKYGTQCGDATIRTVADAMRTQLRDQDLIGRWAGDEFALVLPETGVEGALVVIKKLQEALETFKVCPDKVTLCIGLATYDRQMHTDELIILADDALFRAKSAGPGSVLSA